MSELTQGRLRALELSQGLAPNPNSIRKVAGVTSDGDAAWAFTMWELRRRARTKFALADQMWFTSDGLEMATHENVARLHASLFQEQGEILDATCGIGSDSVALARRGQVRPFDINPVHCEFARLNGEVHGLSIDPTNSSSLDEDWTNRLVYVDPARRGSAGRAFKSSDYEPPLEGLYEKAKTSSQTWLKLSPLLSDQELDEPGHGLLFVSHRGECAEALVELGSSAGPRGRWCVSAETGERLEAGPEPPHADEPLDWVFQADPGAIRGHCLGAFEMEGLGETPGWLTSRSFRTSPWLTTFKTLWHGAWREKTVKEAAKGHSIAAVKTRGLSQLEPRAIQKQFSRLEGQPAELMLYRDGAKIRAILVERIT